MLIEHKENLCSDCREEQDESDTLEDRLTSVMASIHQTIGEAYIFVINQKQDKRYNYIIRNILC